uniref:Kinesin-like protein n=1 Tax=Eriobotrya japonica TaxID=32224 RepID=A0A6C0NCB5_9ROSA|nr:kinesin-like protein [Eriobotrya japonica]
MKKGNRRAQRTAYASTGDDYEKKFHQLELENKAYQKEVEELRFKLANGSSTSCDSSAQKLREDYIQKLTFLEDQVAVLTTKLDAQSQLSVLRRRGDEPTKQLHFEIQRLKAQKVQVQCKLKLEFVQFRMQKASLEKKVLQLKKEGRKSEHEMHKLLDSNQRLKTVLHRKNMEAFMATKRLRQLLESRKALLHKKGAKNGKIDAIQGIEYEFNETAELHELCAQYERQIEEMTEEAASLKDEAEAQQQEMSRCTCQEQEDDCLEKDLGIRDLKEQFVSLSSMVGQLRLNKAELDVGNKSQGTMSQHSISVGSNSYKLVEDITPSASENSNVVKVKTASTVCCSCSKSSLCKTMKCRCRSMGGSGGASCGYVASKCSNRGLTVQIKLNESSQSETVDGILNCSDTTEVEKDSSVAYQGAMLLQNALVQKPAEPNDNLGPRKKPLSDIGNLLNCVFTVNADAAKPAPNKKGRKPAIRLVNVNAEGKKGAEDAMQAEG